MFGGPVKVPPMPKRRGANRETCGEYPYEYGQIVRNPNTDYAAKLNQARQRARDLKQRELAAERQANHEAYSRWRFETAADRRLHMARARVNLTLALRAADADLDRRRQRLREMLMCEDECLTAELVARAQNAPMERLQRARSEQMQLKAQREAERQEQLEQLRLLQYRARCVDIRDLEKSRNNELMKEALIYQMHEKVWNRKKAKDEDKFWEDVLRKNQAAMAEREEKEERAVKARELENVQFHLQQMEATGRAAADERLRMRQEAAALHAMVAKHIEEEDEHGEGKRKKQAEWREALDKQREEKHALNAALEEAERRFDMAQAIYARNETEREDTTKAINDEKTRREVRMFLDYKHAEKRMIMEQEREEEKQLMDIALRANQERERRHLEMENEHRRREEDARRGLLEQLEDRQTRARAAAAAEAAAEEKRAEIRAENRRLDEEYNKRSHEKELRYQRDLVEQQRYTNTLKEREECLERERLEAGRQEEAELDRRVRKLFSQHFPQSINALQIASLAAPPPDMAQPMLAPPPPRKPCTEEEALRGVPGALSAAKAASARQKSPPPRPGHSTGVAPCEDCGGFRVNQPCHPCADPCAEAAFEADRRARAELADKAGPASVTGPWRQWLDKGQIYNGLGPAAACLAGPPPPINPHCHAPPQAQAMFPNPLACEDSMVKSTGRAPEVPPQPQCYMCR